MTGVFTINERPKEVLEKVFESLPVSDCEEWVICFDRTPEELRKWVMERWKAMFPIEAETRTKWVVREGAPGWKTGVAGWNAAWEACTQETVYCFSSEVIHQPDNVKICKELLSGPPVAVFGMCRDSGELGPQTKFPTDPLLLCSSEWPRPLGFIMAFPTWLLRVTGGYLPEYEEGYWFADDDFAMTIFRMGVPFVFDDRISGVHQAHARATLDTPEGQDGIEKNKALYLSRWKELNVWGNAQKLWFNRKGYTVCIPVDTKGLNETWDKLAK
jgi:hypothetical protein